jgi:hypothetical protein
MPIGVPSLRLSGPPIIKNVIANRILEESRIREANVIIQSPSELAIQVLRLNQHLSLLAQEKHKQEKIRKENEEKLQMLISKEKTNDQSGDCIICYDNNAYTVILPCNHKNMCYKCTQQVCILKSRCPICRQHILGYKIVLPEEI